MAANRIVLAEYFTTDDVTLLFGVRADWDEPQVVELHRPLAEIRHYVAEHFGPGTGDRQLSTADRIRSLDLAEWQAQTLRMPSMPSELRSNPRSASRRNIAGRSWLLSR